jgi:small subunit ribosomal protein S1
MSTPGTPETQPAEETVESFENALSQFERTQTRRPGEAGQGREGTVITVSTDSVVLDIGFKTEGILPLAELQNSDKALKPGDKLLVTIKGRDPEGYYQLTRGKVSRPTDWASLEKAFTDKATIVGTVTGVVKGGLSVDVGVRAFMPASRSGTHDAAELGKLVEQEIRCRIIKLDAADEDVVVDRRAVLEEDERLAKDRRYSEVREGEIVRGTVRSLMDYGAFVDLGGVDALLHVGDLAWSRVAKASDLLAVGQEVEVQVLKIDPEKRRISVGMKQLQPDPWSLAATKYKAGDLARGTVTRVVDFGAFVELEPGLEGLIHISELSWSRKVKRVSEVVKEGEAVEAVILAINPAERRISLGLKQALGDPWRDAAEKFPLGTAIEGPITSIMKFGAFVQLSDGIEGMIHVSDMSAEKRLNHPQDMVKVGQVVKAVVLEVDVEKRRLRLGMKQLLPTSIEEYIGEHKVGDSVTGRVVEVSGVKARVELGEGIVGNCKISDQRPTGASTRPESAGPKADLSSLTSMLQARWKGGASTTREAEPIQSGQIRTFRIANLDSSAKKIDLELV